VSTDPEPPIAALDSTEPIKIQEAPVITPDPPRVEQKVVADEHLNTSVDDGKHDDDEDQERIDISPRSLKFEKAEIDYMKELAPLIGRSPRAVKRFLNCYRLVKVGLNEKQFEVFMGTNGDGSGYKAAMILLGIITGTPKVSSSAVEILDRWPERKDKTVKNFLDELFASEEISAHPDGKKLQAFLFKHLEQPHSNEVFREMLSCASRVSRFSFRVIGNEPLGKRNQTLGPQASSPANVRSRPS
jgi:hypothetical protein